MAARGIFLVKYLVNDIQPATPSKVGLRTNFEHIFFFIKMDKKFMKCLESRKKICVCDFFIKKVQKIFGIMKKTTEIFTKNRTNNMKIIHAYL